MAEPLSIAGGKWIRFERYELREGCIAPAQGAKATVYDPWELPERPYEPLRKLAADRNVLTVPREQPRLVAAVIEWCNRYGLLGTLLNRLIAVTLTPRWKRVEFAGKELRDIFARQLETHLHLPSGWRTETIQYGGHSRDPSQLNAPVPRDLWPPEAPRPSALLIDLPGIGSNGGLLKREDLDGTWANHFPDVPFGERATYDYPAPSSLDFWEAYGEPLGDFVQAAWVLGNALEAVLNPAHSKAREVGLSRLTELASCASPGLEPQRNGALQHRWLAGSMLSCLALMAMDDLAHHLLRQCPCGTLFQSSSYQARYCSYTCKNTMQQRRHRKRKRGSSPRRKPSKGVGQSVA